MVGRDWQSFLEFPLNVASHSNCFISIIHYIKQCKRTVQLFLSQSMGIFEIEIQIPGIQELHPVHFLSLM